MNNNQQIGSGTSPSTLIQLGISSLPPIDPSFFNIVDGIKDITVPVPSNDLVPKLYGVVKQTIENFFSGGEDPYKIKYFKYKSKYLQLKRLHGNAKKVKSDKMNKTDLKFFRLDGSSLKGGYSSNVWPVISMIWKKNIDQLGVKSKTDGNIQYKIMKDLITETTQLSPLFNKGSFSAVYKINKLDEKLHEILDTNEYILKIYETVGPIHLFANPKTQAEYKLFEKYFIDIYYYGKISGQARNFNVDDYNNTYIEEKGQKNYDFDYYISKKYNVMPYDPTSYEIGDFPGTNQNKFKFLMSNLKYLDDLQKNNMFHGDYKLTNVGWDNDYNLIMIDYDEETLGVADDKDKKFKSSVRPAWFRYIRNSGLKLDNTFYIKYSVEGLINVIENLNFKVTPKFFNNISLPADFLITK